MRKNVGSSQPLPTPKLLLSVDPSYLVSVVRQKRLQHTPNKNEDQARGLRSFGLAPCHHAPIHSLQKTRADGAPCPVLLMIRHLMLHTEVSQPPCYHLTSAILKARRKHQNIWPLPVHASAVGARKGGFQ